MLILSLLILLSSSVLPYVSAGNENYYARVMYDNVYLYKSPLDIDDYSNVYFILPKTYFVRLIDSSNKDFYEVIYLDNISGFVKKECVQTVVGTPQNPYIRGYNFRVYAEMSQAMRTTPSTKSGASSLVVHIPLLCRDLTYIAEVNGDTLIEGRTNKWYYCKYTADKDYVGYVYSDFCDELAEIPENTEVLDYTTNPTFLEVETPTQGSLPLNSSTTGIVIGIITIPAIIFIFLLVKSSRKGINSRQEVRDY